MSNTENSPSLSAKLRTKDAVNKIKHGSPKLQEVLRQRCRQRMREKRGQLFNKARHGLMETDEDVHETLTEIVRSELSQLATMDIDGSNSILSQDFDEQLTEEEALALENEILAEEEQWMLLEYEILRKEAEMLALYAEESLKETVICPLCERGTVEENANTLACSECDFCLPKKVNIGEFAKILQEKVAFHSSLCLTRPCFMLLPENETIYLYLTCEICPTFALII